MQCQYLVGCVLSVQGVAVPVLESLSLAPCWGASKCVGTNTYLTVIGVWSASGFARFAFDLVAIMQGTYDSSRFSSFHGFGNSGYDLLRHNISVLN